MTIDPVVNLCSRYLAFDVAQKMTHGEDEWLALAEQQDRILDKIVYTPSVSQEGVRAKIRVLITAANYFLPGDDFLFSSIKRDFKDMDMARLSA